MLCCSVLILVFCEFVSFDDICLWIIFCWSVYSLHALWTVTQGRKGGEREVEVEIVEKMVKGGASFAGNET